MSTCMGGGGRFDVYVCVCVFGGGGHRRLSGRSWNQGNGGTRIARQWRFFSPLRILRNGNGEYPIIMVPGCGRLE